VSGDPIRLLNCGFYLRRVPAHCIAARLSAPCGLHRGGAPNRRGAGRLGGVRPRRSREVEDDSAGYGSASVPDREQLFT